MRVLLTNGHRNAGFWLTRWLGTAGHEVIAADCRALAFGLKSRHAHAFEWLPDPTAPEYADHLLALVRRVCPDVLLPLGGLAAVTARRVELEQETALLAADSDAYQTLLDKSRVYDLCPRFGIPHPRVLGTDPQTVAEQLLDPGDDTPWAVIKPRRDFGGGRGLVFLRRREGLTILWQKLAERHGPLIATEFIPGPVDAQYAVQLLFDRNSKLIEFFVLRKLRQWPTGSGITAAAVSTHELALVEQVLPLFRHLRWRGPVEVELKRSIATGTAYVLEINPRFSGTLAFPLLIGIDLPCAMLEASLGRSRPRALEPYYPAGACYWNPLPYARSVFRDLCRAGTMRRALRDLAMPLTRRPVGNPYALSDPGALIGKLGFQLTEALSGALSAREPEPRQ